MAKESPQERAARLAAERAKQRAAERRRNILMVAAVVLVMIGIIGGGFVISRLTSSTPKDSAAAASVGSVTIGSDSAPHKVVIYEDFLCPYCGELEKQTHEELATLADQGKVQVEYRPFNLLQTDYSQHTLEVFQVLAHNSTPEVAKKFHDALYADQPSESASSFPSVDDITATAVAAGADEADIKAALESSAPKWADAATQAAEDAGVQSTPTILLDGTEFVGGSDIDSEAKALLDAVS
ncbi:DsbA family protein [Nocardioides sp. Kera G14]|uniref:DsbA family protein n=1 Tax=Nocardioides sp. Kera G14 TaxID=2884264 RepID=UPI001D0F6BE9|nr:thioredoxin domain-containing protein [Nocardioides sp. Kera G14]UDY24441.1 DsbA family protein [Nocardioides sp. Kera G14]